MRLACQIYVKFKRPVGKDFSIGLKRPLGPERLFRRLDKLSKSIYVKAVCGAENAEERGHAYGLGRSHRQL